MVRHIVVHVCLALIVSSVVGTLSNLRHSKNVAVAESRRTDQSGAVKVVKPAPPAVVNIVTLTGVYEPKEFHPRGVYYIIGRKPRGFRNFDLLQLSVDPGRTDLEGVIQTYSNRGYGGQQAAGLVTDRRLMLVGIPVTLGDFEYSVDGVFLRRGVLSDTKPGMPVLRARIIKSRKGVRLAECEVYFRIEYLGC
jgi:hypothetical protein